MTNNTFERWGQLQANGKKDAAEALLLEALKDPALEQQAMACRAIEYCTAGHWGRAVLPLLQACMEPAEWAYHALLARALSQLGRNDLAVAFLLHGLRRQPVNTQLRSVYWQAAARVLPKAQLRQEAKAFMELAQDPAEFQQLRAIIGSAEPAATDSLAQEAIERDHVSEVSVDSTKTTVDVLVPVFGGYQHTRRCIESLLAAQTLNNTSHTIIVLDDAGAEPSLTAYLKQLAEGGRIQLHRHAHNLGFIDNINYGMSLNPWHDVVWINSDTAVHDNWLDRLRTAAYSRPKVGSVTPLSNNGELLSLGRAYFSEPMPDEDALAAIDGIAHCLGLTPVEIPAGCGFCFYIPRVAINEVGLLNSVNLKRGYGEETEWSLRARQRGFIHLAAVDTFVAHEGGGSFGLEKSLRVFQNNGWIRRAYPDVDVWFQNHPGKDSLEAARQALQLARLPQLVAWAKDQKPRLEIMPAFLASRLPTQGKARPAIRLAYKQNPTGLDVSLKAPLTPGWGMSFQLPVQVAGLRQALDAIVPYVSRVFCCEAYDSLPAELKSLLDVEPPATTLVKPLDRKDILGKTWLIADPLSDPDILAAWHSLAQLLAEQNRAPGGRQTLLCFVEPGPHAHGLRATGAAYLLPRLEGLPLHEQIQLANVCGALTVGQLPQERVFAQALAGYCGLPLWVFNQAK